MWHGYLIRVWLKQRIRFPLFERHFRRISVLRGASRRGGGGCYDMLAERYGERIRCFTLTLQYLSHHVKIKGLSLVPLAAGERKWQKPFLPSTAV